MSTGKAIAIGILVGIIIIRDPNIFTQLGNIITQLTHSGGH